MRAMLLAAALLLAAGAAQAADITADHVWARATAPGAPTGAAYMTVTNTGPADRLVSVSAPVAATAELHQTTEDKGVMRMREVAGIALDPGKKVTLQPGGYHVMLIGLKAPLKAGESFPLTLRFDHAAPMTVTATIEAVGGAQGHGGKGGHGGMGGMSGHK